MPIHSSSFGNCKQYTPVWGSSGTAPAIGNGTITGWYILDSDFLFVQILVIMGSTTTYGTGNYVFTIPSGNIVANTHPGSPTVTWQPGAAVAVDSGTAYRHGTAAFLGTGDYCLVVTQGTAGYWSPTIPHTWANTDEISITGLMKAQA